MVCRSIRRPVQLPCARALGRQLTGGAGPTSGCWALSPSASLRSAGREGAPAGGQQRSAVWWQLGAAPPGVSSAPRAPFAVPALFTASLQPDGGSAPSGPRRAPLPSRCSHLVRTRPAPGSAALPTAQSFRLHTSGIRSGFSVSLERRFYP